MKIIINDLEFLCEFILTKIEISGLKEINIDIDYYWYIGFDDAYNFTTENPKILVGSLIDDLEWLEKVFRKENPSTTIDFNRLGNVIQIMGDQFYTSRSQAGKSIIVKITINDIKQLCERLIKKTIKAGFKELDISFNQYWYIDSYEAYDLTLRNNDKYDKLLKT